MIRAPSALYSINRRGLLHDGPVNSGGIGDQAPAARVAQVIETVPAVTTADKILPKKEAVLKKDAKQTAQKLSKQRNVLKKEADTCAENLSSAEKIGTIGDEVSNTVNIWHSFKSSPRTKIVK